MSKRECGYQACFLKPLQLHLLKMPKLKKMPAPKK